MNWRSPLTGALLLAGAAGGPYVLYETDAGKSARDGTAALLSGSSTGDQNAADSSIPQGMLTAYSNDSSRGAELPWAIAPNNPAAHPLNAESLKQARLQPRTIQSLSQILRFDISPDWVLASFPRVSTILADMDLDGYRVPIVTGTQPSDIAGTLTYYFDHYQKLQRVTLHGVTGDPARFVAELQRDYHMRQEPSLGGRLYVLKWNGYPMSLCQVAPAPVIQAGAPYARYSLFIELNQPGLQFGLSPEADSLIQHGRKLNLW